jgi:serine/threonine-protein kinase
MQPRSQQISTCQNCGGVLEETSGGELGCMSCLLQAGIVDEDEVAQDSTSAVFEGSLRFGIYEIDRREDGSLYELGRGAMGVTYRATDTTLQRKVALKIIKTDIAERSIDARERFMREARAAAALRHEHIATVYQFGMRVETGQYFYAMELIEGETLDERVRRAGPLDARATIQIAQQVTLALAAAEKQGLVHRDLKPANLMLVSSDGETSNNKKLLVKIIDFGLAKAIHTAPDPKSLTHDRFVGTPAFASPEQFEHSTLDVRSDIYSLGETIWFALTGKTPFAGRSVEEIHRAQQSNVLPIEQLKAAHVPSHLRSLLESMLALEPASRPDTHELAARLQRCSPEARSKQRSQVALASALIALAVAAGWIVWKSEFTRHPSPKSVAVLPLVNQSDDPKEEYFSDGLSEELIVALVQIGELKVIGRSSSFLFKGQSGDTKTIGEKLGVAHLIEGTIRKQGDRVRIVAELINAADGRSLWSETYDRQLKDVFAVQNEIAKAVADQMKVKLLGQSARPEITASTQDPAAHIALLQSDFYFQRQTKESVRKAITFLQEAVRLDPNYALAYAKLGQAWRQHAASFATDDDLKAYDEARMAADKAVSLAPDLGEVRMTVGLLALTPGLDFPRGEKEFRRVLESSPNNAAAKNALCISLFAQGRLTEADETCREALSLDPLNALLWYNLGRITAGMSRYGEAEEAFRKALELQPSASRFHTCLATLDILQNRPAQAMANAQLESEGFWHDYAIALVQQAHGDRSAADGTLKDFIAKDSNSAAFQIAVLYAIRKEPDEMFKWLETAYAKHDSGLNQLAVTPFFFPYRDDPRFTALCQKLNVQSSSSSARSR